MNPLNALYRTGTKIALTPLKSAAATIEGARRLEQQMRPLISGALEEAFLAAIDATLTRLLADDIVDRTLDKIETSGAAQRIAERLLDDGIAEQIADRALAGPAAERVLAAALGGPLVEETVAQLLKSEAIWVLVDEIARSPSVTEAITQQGSGFLEQVTERARDRSRYADNRVQGIADKLRRGRRVSAAAPESLPHTKPR